MSKSLNPDKPSSPAEIVECGTITQARTLIRDVIHKGDRKLFKEVWEATEGLEESRRLSLIKDLMKEAKETDDLAHMKDALDACSLLFADSFTKTYLDHPEIGLPCDDAYAQRYLKEFKEKGGDSFRRISKTGIPCSAMEEYLVNQLSQESAVIIVANKSNQPHAVWMYKDSRQETDSEWDILVNLSTLEAYTPNKILGSYLRQLKRGTVIEMDDLLSQAREYGDGLKDQYKQRIVKDESGSESKQLVNPTEIHFARMVHYADNTANITNLDSEVPKLMEKRAEVLEKYLPLDDVIFLASSSDSTSF